MKHLQEIVEAAQARGRRRLAVAYGQDSHTIEAVYDAYNEGLVDPILYGDRIVIEQVCREYNIDSFVFYSVDIFKAILRQTTLQRHLTSLETNLS